MGKSSKSVKRKGDADDPIHDTIKRQAFQLGLKPEVAPRGQITLKLKRKRALDQAQVLIHTLDNELRQARERVLVLTQELSLAQEHAQSEHERAQLEQAHAQSLAQALELPPQQSLQQLPRSLPRLLPLTQLLQLPQLQLPQLQLPSQLPLPQPLPLPLPLPPPQMPSQLPLPQPLPLPPPQMPSQLPPMPSQLPPMPSLRHMRRGHKYQQLVKLCDNLTLPTLSVEHITELLAGLTKIVTLQLDALHVERFSQLNKQNIDVVGMIADNFIEIINSLNYALMFKHTASSGNVVVDTAKSTMDKVITVYVANIAVIAGFQESTENKLVEALYKTALEESSSCTLTIENIDGQLVFLLVLFRRQLRELNIILQYHKSFISRAINWFVDSRQPVWLPILRYISGPRKAQHAQHAHTVPVGTKSDIESDMFKAFDVSSMFEGYDVFRASEEFGALETLEVSGVNDEFEVDGADNEFGVTDDF